MGDVNGSQAFRGGDAVPMTVPMTVPMPPNRHGRTRLAARARDPELASAADAPASGSPLLRLAGTHGGRMAHAGLCDTAELCDTVRSRGDGADGAGRAARSRFDPIAVLGAAGLHDLVSPVGAHHGALSRIAGDSPLVWVRDAISRLEFGTLCARGLATGGLDPSRLIEVRVSRARDVLWAMEEAIRAGLPVVGEIEGTPRALDFTATRRLEMRARRRGVRCVLVRTGQRAVDAGSSGAHWRWRISPGPGAADPYDPKAPGAPRWLLELTRARTRTPGRWLIEGAHDDGPCDGVRTSHRLRVVDAPADPPERIAAPESTGAPDDAARAGNAGADRRGACVLPLRKAVRAA